MTCRHRRTRNSVIGAARIEVWNCAERGLCTEADHGRKMLDGSLMAVCETCPLHTDRTKQRQLTIGMPFYRDWPGLWATIQSIRLNHWEVADQIEIVVIDNDPSGKPNEAGEHNHSFKARQLCERIGAKYEHFTTVAGTAAAKGRVFDLATAPWVLVMDCHVLLPNGVLWELLNYTRANPDSLDLLQGPCIGDGGVDDIVGTHMREAWGSLMYGQWSVDERVKQGEPFEIPMHGCGLFACRKSTWPKFHPLLRGFGPEEWHIHQRIRRNGGRALCLPWLKWCHRFGNPDGTKPPGLSHGERLRGHLITWLDTGNDDQEWLAECRKHFLASGTPPEMFESVLTATRAEFVRDWLPVGDKLHEILLECGISRDCPVCRDWQRKMNAWGVAGCEARRPEILARLNAQAKSASWFEAIQVAGRGYLTTAAILDEAIKRATVF
jgi:hypothetical protein